MSEVAPKRLAASPEDEAMTALAGVGLIREFVSMSKPTMPFSGFKARQGPPDFLAGIFSSNPTLHMTR